MKKYLVGFFVILLAHSAGAKLPLTLPAYPLGTGSAQVTLARTYYSASVYFTDGKRAVYTATLTQQAPTLSLPPNLQVGSMTLVSGKLTMSLPGNGLTGTVKLDGTAKEGNGTPQAIHSTLGSWNLNQ